MEISSKTDDVKVEHRSSLRETVVESGRAFTRRIRWIDIGFIVLFVVLLIYTALTSENFFTERNISNILRQNVPNGLISLGMLFVILTGGIDLSVGSVVALAAILTAGLQADTSIPVAIAVALGASAACGLFNGIMVARFKLEPFIVTLATMGAIRGGVFVISDTPQMPADPAFRRILGGFVGGGGWLDSLAVAAVIMLACFPLAWIFLNRTTTGRAVVAIGGNKEAVRLAGINVESKIILVYVLSAFLSGMAGILLAARLGISQPSLGSAYELDAIAAVVIGGGVMGGGGGGALGTLGGVFTLGLINNLLNLQNVQSYYQQIVKGAIILFAVLARRKQR
ncbi:ABC transporter permease [Aggregatilinea lenta]|uniref:ABC transporter permease n=1 Tax=Aggregatilinea lenta TaxID=913108 RepID=UPI0013C33F8C|nr:ABC transporter permease [Aggregatilinea lenta]